MRESDAVRATLGLRFAEPVDGARRFAAPVAVEGIERIAGGGFGPAAWQMPHPDFTFGDDCLTLNVWAPADAERLPVLVWIHGGGYIGGTAAQPELDAGELALALGAVIVAVQYRLGVWGFLDMRAEAPGAVANAGLLDVLTALDWVRRHIEEFGGDPERITIDGASAGAGIVGALLASPVARGRVRGAILQSAPLATVQTEEASAADARRFTEILGQDPSSASVEALLEAQHQLTLEVARQRPGTLACSPVIDGRFLHGSPVDTLAAGLGEAVPVLGMWNSDEGTAFRDDPVVRTDAAALQALLAVTAEDLRRREPGWPDDPSRMRVATEAYFAAPLRRALAGHARVAPSWMARFDHRTEVLDRLGLGASHSAEGPFLFGNRDRAAWAFIAPDGPTDDDLRIHDEMQSIWSRFVRGGAAPWAPIAIEGRPVERVIR
ncbi:carboxylesterase family protein [Microbacterium sp. TNHR37B]|uniref:carboxylesterase family protein n=1 Tax=Microbacterium sp. TNHR37B TaxID=1775956 RepID=UPI0007B2B459|nr:carboxylesterase family protein [Microbacterium sp. TNHR37B]KZE90602.1 Para-nitrobenzyl esterase [Microbacterium sp. TNHR37B]